MTGPRRPWKTEDHEGWTITLHRRRMGFQAVANKVGGRPLWTATHRGKGAAAEALRDIRIQIDIERALEGHAS